MVENQLGANLMAVETLQTQFQSINDQKLLILEEKIILVTKVVAFDVPDIEHHQILIEYHTESIHTDLCF